MIEKNKVIYDETIQKIKSNIKMYESLFYDMRYKLFLSNGDVLDIEYPESCIPHLLGVNLDYIRMLNIYKAKSSYDLLTEFLDNNYSAYSKSDNISSIFSEYVDIKNNDFYNKLRINLSDIQFIIHYQKDRIYMSETIENPCEYYVVQKKEGKKLLLLGLVKQKGRYVPQTSQELDLSNEKDATNLKNLLFHQHIMFCNSLKYTSDIEEDYKQVFLSFTQRSDKMIYLKTIANKYSSIIRVENDYVYILDKIIKNNSSTNLYKSIIQRIVSLMEKHEIIDLNDFEEEIDEDIKQLIDAYNDSIVKDNEENSIKYSEIKAKYEILKKEIEQLRIETERLQKENEEKRLLIEQLNQENENNNEIKIKILELFGVTK